MESIGPSLFILGLFMTSALTQQTTTQSVLNTLAKQFNNSANATAITPITITIANTTTTNATMTNATVTKATTTSTAQSANTGDRAVSTPTHTMPPATPESTTPSSPSSTSKSVSHQTKFTASTFPTAEPNVQTSDATGIIIISLMFLAVIVFGTAFYFARRRKRRYTVDLTSRPDDVEIPLSTVEPDVPVDSAAQNGMQTFGSAQAEAKESQEPETKPEGEEEQRADPDKAVVDPHAAAAAVSAPSPDGSADKAEDHTGEPSPAAPVEPSLEDQTDDEGTVSNNTSEEMLKEPNENNSNNADVNLNTARDLTSSSIFSEVPLGSP